MQDIEVWNGQILKTLLNRVRKHLCLNYSASFYTKKHYSYGFAGSIQNQKLIEVLENILITYKTNVLSSSDIKSDYVISSIYSKEHIKFLFLLSSFYAFMCKFSIDNFNSSMEQFLILKEKTVSHFYQIHLKSKSQIQNENAQSI